MSRIEKRLERIADKSNGLFQAEAQRALHMLALGFSNKRIVKRILRARPYLDSRFIWNGKI